MDIIIFSGQSNMQGQTESLPYTRIVNGAYEYRMLEDNIIPLKHPVGENINEVLLGAHEGNGSLLPAFCRAFVMKSGQNVLAVHAAKGATTIAEWLPDHFSGRYETMVRKVRGALRAAQNVDKVYFIWLQGESDAMQGTKTDLYKQRMRLFRANLVKDLSVITGFFMIRVGKFTEDDRDIEIIRAQEELCADKEFVMLTRLTGYLTQRAKFMNPFAHGHYNNAGMEKLGATAGRNLAKFRLGKPIILEKEPYPELSEKC